MISPMKAIREKCLDCCGKQTLEVKFCGASDCPIWKFRLGIHPGTSKNMAKPLLGKDFADFCASRENDGTKSEAELMAKFQKELDTKPGHHEQCPALEG